MSAADQQVETRAPLGVVTADERPAGFCEVIVVIPDLQKTLFGNKPANGSTVEVVFADTSFTLKASVKDKNKRTIHYEQVVKKLPGTIDDARSHYKIGNGKIKLYLKKAEAGSWAGALSQHGIDQSP